MAVLFWLDGLFDERPDDGYDELRADFSRELQRARLPSFPRSGLLSAARDVQKRSGAFGALRRGVGRFLDPRSRPSSVTRFPPCQHFFTSPTLKHAAAWTTTRARGRDSGRLDLACVDRGLLDTRRRDPLVGDAVKEPGGLQGPVRSCMVPSKRKDVSGLEESPLASAALPKREPARR